MFKLTLHQRILFLLLTSTSPFGQSSLWQDKSPYVNDLKAGQMIEVKIDEVFHINIDSKWDTSTKIKFQLSPDTKNLPFMYSSEQSKVKDRQSKARYRIRDRLNFSLQAIVGAPQQNNIYPIQAQKSLIIDLKPTRIRLTGLINPKHVRNDRISSKHIANLNLHILTDPPPERDSTIQLKPPKPEDIRDPQNPPPAKAELSEAEKQKILLKHLQEIIGILNR